VNPSDYKKVIPLGEKFKFLMGESGYFHIQATKPDTVGVGLNTSPLGLAVYIIEKFSTWSFLGIFFRDANFFQRFFAPAKVLFQDFEILFINFSAGPTSLTGATRTAS
jgi:hypothetical protein